MALNRLFTRRAVLALVLVCSLAVLESAAKEVQDTWNLELKESELQKCDAVQRLNALKEDVEAGESPVMRKVFAVLFPFNSAGWNAVLGTFYISSVPNFILAVIPSQINPNTLNTMTAFATGGLLSDVFLHLVPHSFMGEHQGSGVHFVMVEEKKNILIGLGIFVGFASFFVMEKTLRVLSSDDEGGHGHSHSHAPPANGTAVEATNGTSTALATSEKDGLRSRHDRSKDLDSKDVSNPEQEMKGTTGPSVLSAYLNLFGDFVHNITDGLAMAASFYSSPLIGATTTLACFAHEIPHEIADYSILIRSGFTKRQAMQSQYITAVGAFIGTFMGIAIHNLSASGDEDGHGSPSAELDLAAAIRQNARGLLGTSAQLADLVIPFVAGGFMYIGAVAVLPTLLQESKSGKQALREFGAMAFGVLCMFFVAWNE